MKLVKGVVEWSPVLSIQCPQTHCVTASACERRWEKLSLKLTLTSGLPQRITLQPLQLFVILRSHKKKHHRANLPLSVNDNSSPNMYVEKKDFSLDVTCWMCAVGFLLILIFALKVVMPTLFGFVHHQNQQILLKNTMTVLPWWCNNNVMK